MRRYVAFLRAINVGGRVVKMEQLRTICEAMGLANVKTFIASGNVLFDSPAKNVAALEDAIGKALRQALGYEVVVFIRTAVEMEEISELGGEAPPEGAVYVGFLPVALDAREKEIVQSFASPVDELRVHKREVYWRAAKRFSDAVFQPAKMEKALGKPATFRSVTTVRKITALMTAPRAAR